MNIKPTKAQTDFLKINAPFKAFIGQYASGKTTAGILEAVRVMKDDIDSSLIIVSKSFSMANQALNALRKELPDHEKIVAAANVEFLRGREADYVWFEEWSLFEPLPHVKWRKSAWITTSPPVPTVFVETSKNPHLPDGYFFDMAKQYPWGMVR